MCLPIFYLIAKVKLVKSYNPNEEVSIAPLVVFRILFGALLVYSIGRTWIEGWIDELYVRPRYHFQFFDWMPLPNEDQIYLIFIGLLFSAIGVLLGLFYRFSAVLFFLLFTYVELIDKTYYLNHYYLVSILIFWMIWVPAHRTFSLDSLFFPKIKNDQCRSWHILLFKVQLSIVYFYAGYAKVNSDWLLRAHPLASWLPGLYSLPVLGSWLHLKWVAYLFSWFGCFYDLSIWLFLWLRKTKAYAYVMVLIFHVLTAILFPRIGMFPYIMMTSTIIFLDPDLHEKTLDFLSGRRWRIAENEQATEGVVGRSFITYILALYFFFQILIPLRYLTYNGNIFWNELGYRFSWRVMLMEKNGMTEFILKDPQTGLSQEIDQTHYLTAFQRQQLRSQPDMMLQFANYIGSRFYRKNGYEPEIYVKSRLSLNGRRSQRFTDETRNIYKDNYAIRDGWILQFDSGAE